MSTRTLAYWLALVDRLVETRFSGALEEHGITRIQWRVLTVLDPEPATHEALAEALAELPTTSDDESAAEQLDELLDSGWVEDLAGRYALSERGRDAHDHISKAVAALRATVLAGISAQEEATTIAALERMARNLGWNG